MKSVDVREIAGCLMRIARCLSMRTLSLTLDYSKPQPTFEAAYEIDETHLRLLHFIELVDFV